MNIKVVSQRKLNPELGWMDVRVDRNSLLGNPFELTNEAEREEVVQAYRKWLWANIERFNNRHTIAKDFNRVIDPKSIRPNLVIARAFKHPSYLDVITELQKLKEFHSKGVKLRLMCWCYPRKCHADIIKSCIEWMIKEEITFLKL